LVIGAGAAGLMSALRAAQAGASVVLLDSQERLGAKILISGGGRCNVTNVDVTERHYHTNGPLGFVRRVLQQFDHAETIRFFEDEMDVRLKLEETGKYFPVSDRANSVLDALLDACASAGVRIRRGCKVRRLAPSDGGWIARTDDLAFHGDAAILCSGGLSLPRTGSDGSGYALARSQGHSLVETCPALTPLAGPRDWLADLRGIALPVRLRLSVDGERKAERAGSFLFAHFGYSGPAALNLSRHWIRADAPIQDRKVVASFLPDWKPERLSEWWRARAAASPKKGAANALDEILPARLADALCAFAEVRGDLPLNQVAKGERNRLLESILAFPLPVTGALGYEKAEATAGGVPLDELDANTMMSRLAPGLFLAGEILDVDGWLGGYNFQWAWSGGTVAGRGAAAYVKSLRA
jgi:predicted Rossmann fold flavoprotein